MAHTFSNNQAMCIAVCICGKLFCIVWSEGSCAHCNIVIELVMLNTLVSELIQEKLKTD